MFNCDTFETKATNDSLFEPVEGKCAPYGLVLVVFNGSHFVQTINKWNKEGPFFQIGEELPEAVLKMCNLTSKEWSKLTIESTSEHNQKVLKDKSKKNIYSEMHATVSYPLYDSQSLDTIIQIDEKSCKRNQRIEKKDSSTLMSQFIDSVPDCEVSLKPSYLAFKIFEFVKKKSLLFKKIDVTRLPKLGYVCLRKKSTKTKTFMGGLSEELKIALNEPIINYSLFIKAQDIEDVDGLAVSSYPTNKNNLKKNFEYLPSMEKNASPIIQENSKEISFMGEKNEYKKPDGYTTPNSISNEFHSLVTPSPIGINWNNLQQDSVFFDEPINSRIHLPPIKEVESMEKKPNKTSTNNTDDVFPYHKLQNN